MISTRHLFRQLITLALLTVAGSSFANSDAAFSSGPRWACWYASANLTIQCLLKSPPLAGSELRAAEVASSIDRRLPALVKTIWGSPEKLSGRHIAIPLMSTPFEMDFVALLAKSVMCGTRPDCSVDFDRNSDGKAALRAAASVEGNIDPTHLAELEAQASPLFQEEADVPAAPRKRRRGLFFEI